MEKYCLLYGLFVTSFYFSVVIAQPVTTVTSDSERREEKNSTKPCNVELDFSNMDLKTIKKNFVSSPYINSLTLQYNGITSLTENTFDSLSNLEHLDLSNNRLTTETLFSFGSVHSLKSLILDNNFTPHQQSSSYCYNYNCCSRKQYFNNYRCVSKYSNMQVAYNYPNVNYLSIRNIYIDSVSSELETHFPKLSRLDLSENNFEKLSDNLMTSIPSTVTDLILDNVELTALRNLEVKPYITLLQLSFNNFNTLSSRYCESDTLCLNGLYNLKSLFISGCSIRTIEGDAFKDLNNLMYLDISDNNFEKIPDESFNFMPNLTGLNISRNSLSALPKTNSLQNLTILIMDEMKNNLIFNSLEELPELPILEALSLRKNQLSSISSTFLNKLPKLRILDLSNNQIISLKSWSWQSNLQKLHLNSNKISDIDDLELSEAKSLELLDLQNNMITSVKLSSLKNLKDDLVFKL